MVKLREEGKKRQEGPVICFFTYSTDNDPIRGETDTYSNIYLIRGQETESKRVIVQTSFPSL
jgi:hypothetical protein